MKRTLSVELRTLREQLDESPPPPPPGATVREWFAGLALMNAELMKGIAPHERGTEAARLADELISALATAKLPSEASMEAPSSEQLLAWELDIKAKQEAKQRRDRDTVPVVKKRTLLPPAYSSVASPGRYSEVSPSSDEPGDPQHR
jgi:hypothetical protein